MLSIGIIGSRTFNDYSLLKEKVDNIKDIKRIVSGGAKGADSLAKRYAQEHKIPITEHLPDWSKGKIGAYERNVKIVQDSDIILAFWDGESKGTKMTLNIAKREKKKRDLDIRIVYVKEDE